MKKHLFAGVMVTEKDLSLRRSVPFLLVGILLFLIYIYFFVGITEILNIIYNVNVYSYGLAVIVLLVNMVIISAVWQYFLHIISIKVPFRKTFLFTWIGTFVDLLVPAESISGDASKIYLMTQESNEDAGKVVASVISHRILAMIISISSLISSSVVLYVFQYELPALVFNLILLIIIGTGIALFFILLCILKETLTRRIIDILLGFFEFITKGHLKVNSIRNSITKSLSIFHESIRLLLNYPTKLVVPIILALVSWFLSAFLSYLVFLSLGQQVNFVLVLIVHSISVNIQSIPIGIPAEVGFVEIVMSSLYGLLGVDVGIAAAGTVLIRLLTVWLRISIGFISVQWIDLKELAKNLHKYIF